MSHRKIFKRSRRFEQKRMKALENESWPELPLPRQHDGGHHCGNPQAVWRRRHIPRREPGSSPLGGNAHRAQHRGKRGRYMPGATRTTALVGLTSIMGGADVTAGVDEAAVVSVMIGTKLGTADAAGSRAIVAWPTRVYRRHAKICYEQSCPRHASPAAATPTPSAVRSAAKPIISRRNVVSGPFSSSAKGRSCHRS